MAFLGVNDTAETNSNVGFEIENTSVQYVNQGQRSVSLATTQNKEVKISLHCIPKGPRQEKCVCYISVLEEDRAAVGH